MLFLFFLLLCPGEQAPTVLNLEIDPRHHRAPITFHVSWQRPTLVVFNRIPDGKIINGDVENWFIGAPPHTPDHTFHFKPKNQSPALMANSFLFFDGYPVELVYRSTGDGQAYQSLVYINVASPVKKGKPAVDLASKQPNYRTLPHLKVPPPGPALPKSGEIRTKLYPFGEVRWLIRTATPTVFFKPRAHMAGLESVEVVRARKPLFGGVRQAQPLTKTYERLDDGFSVVFQLVHLTRREHYFLRLFFKGSKRPVYVRLRGYRSL